MTSRAANWLPPRPVRLVIYALLAVMVAWTAHHRRHASRTRPSAPRTPNRATPRIRPVPLEIAAARDAGDRSDLSASLGAVTYSGQVANILQRKCQPCHRPGQVAPFALRTYDDARRWATSIAEVITDRRMPPWHADPRVGAFENDRSLSASERAILLAWVEQGKPLGDAAQVPETPIYPASWTIGEPDLVFTMPEDFNVPADGVVPYRHFRVPTNLDHDVWIQAAEARPGNRSVVHHVWVFLDDKIPNEEGKPERPPLVGYAPGDFPSIYPEGTAKRIPAGAVLRFQVHYTPIGKPQTDRSSAGFILAKSPPNRLAVTKGVYNHDFEIPPGAADYEVRSSFTFPFDAQLLSLMPHMHLRGKDFLFRATYPNGRSEVLLSVPAFDFGWQSVYRLAKAKPMPKGSRIDCVAHFDNSPANMNNPDPSQTVRWGEQSWDEMMTGYIDYSRALPLSR